MFPSACSIFCFQGELGHWSPKSRFIHTNHKWFVKQLTSIEHQQTHIHCICALQHMSSSQMPGAAEAMTVHPEEHHFIGKSQNFPVNISTLLWEYQDNLAIKVQLLVCGDYLKNLNQVQIHFRILYPSWKTTSYLVWKLHCCKIS